MSDFLLSTNHLTKIYGKQKSNNDISIHIKQGAIYGLIGRNGAGKTTFLRMISGLSKPTSGEISLFGYQGEDLKKVRSRVGCLIENPGIYPGMTAYENLKLKCIMLGICKKGYIEELLELVGLKDVGKKKVKKFSLGMKQRLGIALALVGEPDLLVLDEPINGLDPQGIIEIRETILSLNEKKNMTIIISSHILEELSKIATDYGIINKGELIQELTREELTQQCSERIEICMDEPEKALPILDKLNFKNYQMIDSEHIYVKERLDDSALINMELAKAGLLVKSISVCNENLEDYFMEITGGAIHA